MPSTQRKRVPSSKATAAIAAAAKVAKSSKTRPRKKASRQRSAQSPTVIPSRSTSPPKSAQSPPASRPTTPPPDIVESFQYYVWGVAITPANGCLFSKRYGPFDNGLCCSYDIETELTNGIENHYKLSTWEITLKMAFPGGRKKRLEQVSITEIIDDWQQVEELLRLQIQRGIHKKDIAQGILPIIEVVFSVKKLTTTREDTEASRARIRQQRRDELVQEQATQSIASQRDISPPLSPPTSSRNTVTSRREADAPAVLQDQLRRGEYSGIIAKHLQCPTDGCGNQWKFCYKTNGAHYRVEKSQIKIWADHYELRAATLDEPPAVILAQILRQPSSIDGRKGERRAQASVTTSVSSSSPPPVINNYMQQPSWPPQYYLQPPLPLPPPTATPVLLPPLEPAEPYSSPPGPDTALLTVRYDFFQWLARKFDDAQWVAKVANLGALARQHEWDFLDLRGLAVGETRAYKIAIAEHIADGILSKMNRYISEFKRSYSHLNRDTEIVTLLGVDTQHNEV